MDGSTLKMSFVSSLMRTECYSSKSDQKLPRVTKYYSPTGRRNHGRPLKRLQDTWDQNGSTSGPTPWKIYDDDDEWSVHSALCDLAM